MIKASTPLYPGTGWLATTGPRDLWRVIAQIKVEEKPTDNVKKFFYKKDGCYELFDKLKKLSF